MFSPEFPYLCGVAVACSRFPRVGSGSRKAGEGVETLGRAQEEGGSRDSVSFPY